MFRLHDVADHRVGPVLVLHLRLQLEVLQVETHLGFLHLLRGGQQGGLAAAPG
jgi:hypothetical protein